MIDAFLYSFSVFVCWLYHSSSSFAIPYPSSYGCSLHLALRAWGMLIGKRMAAEMRCLVT